MSKVLILAASSLLSLGLACILPTSATGSPDGPPPPEKEKAKKKGEPGPKGDLHRAYDLLRRIKAEDGPSGRSDERTRDWTERAVRYYRRGLDALTAEDPRVAHEYGVAAHDLARAVDHVRNASRFDRPDPDLPPPPEAGGPEEDGGQARHDLRRAYDRIRDTDMNQPEAKFYLDAARDLYNAARRDALANRHERSGELAKAAEAITHVPEHLAHATNPAPDPKAKKKGDGPEPKAKKKGERPDGGDDLPPPLPSLDHD